ncbi:hypothetical protein JL721_3036 [Aureococcus anophagefferens]|nr:hypothetical protein JL721_3036 [Aureococcus anophagefferens]
MIARPKISRNEWKTAEIGASKVGNFAPFSCPGHADLVAYFLRRGASITRRNHRGLSAVSTAVHTPDVRCLDILAHAGADLASRGLARGNTLAQSAASRGNLNALAYLASRGVNLFERDFRGLCSLDAAAKQRNAVNGAGPNATLDFLYEVLRVGGSAASIAWTRHVRAARRLPLVVMRALVVRGGARAARADGGDGLRRVLVFLTSALDPGGGSPTCDFEHRSEAPGCPSMGMADCPEAAGALPATPTEDAKAQQKFRQLKAYTRDLLKSHDRTVQQLEETRAALERCRGDLACERATSEDLARELEERTRDNVERLAAYGRRPADPSTRRRDDAHHDSSSDATSLDAGNCATSAPPLARGSGRDITRALRRLARRGGAGDRDEESDPSDDDFGSRRVAGLGAAYGAAAPGLESHGCDGKFLASLPHRELDETLADLGFDRLMRRRIYFDLDLDVAPLDAPNKEPG